MRNDPDSLMLFAAGRGTRMGAVTAKTPKPLVRAGGRALIDWSLDICEVANVGNVVVNVHHFADQIETHLAARNVVFSRETDALLDTGGGLRHALPLLGPDPVFTLNSDAVWNGPNPLHILRANWDTDRMDGLLLIVAPDNAHAHPGTGDFALDDDRLIRGGPNIYTGAQIIRTDTLRAIAEPVFSLNLLWDEMIKTERLFGVYYPGQWCDVGTPAGLAQADAILAGSNDV